MQVSIREIPLREVLHYLGWRGGPVEEQILEQIRAAMTEALSVLEPQVIVRCFTLNQDQALENTVFMPKGNDIHALLDPCESAVLMAATLGAQSERMILRHQAKSSADALVMDAMLSAAIEAVCDEQEQILREQFIQKGLYLTDRFSPGYGDMPLEQTKEICSVLQTQKHIGLSVSHSGIMIPRKSVTAILGVSKTPQNRRPSRCSLCSMKKTCAMSEMK